MTLEEFRADVLRGIKLLPKCWRHGQKVFNYIEENYGVAGIVQFQDGIDCFYDDNNADRFLEAAYRHIK